MLYFSENLLLGLLILMQDSAFALLLLISLYNIAAYLKQLFPFREILALSSRIIRKLILYVQQRQNPRLCMWDFAYSTRKIMNKSFNNTHLSDPVGS